MMLRGCLLGIGTLLLLDTILVGLVSNPNLGVFLPGLIGLPLFLIGLFWTPVTAFFAHPVGKAVQLILIAGYAFFLVSFAVVTAHITGFIMDKPEPDADVVLVLGAGLRNGMPSQTLAARLDCAAEYLEDNPETKVIVSGGQGSDESRSEAEAMREYLLRKGIAGERIFAEDKSTSTQENFLFSRAILSENFAPDARVVVVSSDFHLYRAYLIAKKQGLAVETMGNASLPWLLPNFYLREYVAVMGYRLLGRLG